MKGKMCVLISALVIVLSMTACGKFTCDLCMQEKTGRKYKTELLGQEVTLCKDCHDEIEELRDEYETYYGTEN